MASVAFTYNGSNQLVAACTGLTPATDYDLLSFDAASSVPTATSDGSGNVTLTITDIGGMSAGDTFYAYVVNDVGAANIVGVITLKYGTSGSTDQAVTATWSFNGTAIGGTVTATFTGTVGVHYKAGKGAAFGSAVVGTGGSDVASYTGNFTGVSYVGVLLDDDAGLIVAARAFTIGSPSSGYSGLAASPTVGRVLIAFDDPPLEPDPTWTRIDSTDNLVSGYDVHSGKQTELDNIDTGTATVYLNDTQGLFDPANPSSPYFGKLDGKQILLQLYNPVTATWVKQFRGHINDYGFDINPATNRAGEEILATIQVECVDIFDYGEGYKLTPYPIDGDVPPAGSEGTVFYEDTAGTVDDRIIQILTDVGLDSTRYIVFTGNVSVQETKYDPGDSALQALRDAADAELPTIANIYVDKEGRFVFHGRYSRFDPDAVSAGANWTFTRWKVGDGLAIIDDATRAQIRVLAYSRPRSEVINSAIAWPQHDSSEDNLIATQAYQDATSISAYGLHAGPAMSDLIIKAGTTTGNDKWVETAKYAELIVKNHKDPENTIRQLTAKSLPPGDPRAAATWDAICSAEISDIINARIGYPNGVGIDSDPPGDGKDYYIEGFSLRVRPLNIGYDNVEVDWEVSPAVWSMDTHAVFGFSGVTASHSAAGKAGSVVHT